MNFMNTNYCPLKFSYYSLMMTMLLQSPITFYTLYTNTTILMNWHLCTINTALIMFPLILDTKSLVMSMTVMFIGANVLKFTKTYMVNDPFINRFLLLVLLFILSMNMLLFLPHLMTLLLGWDGLGLTSFILIIYYQNPKSLAAGILTALTNRIGDGLILISIAWTFSLSNWSLLHLWSSPMTPFICMSLLAAAMTKSAQLPFSSWLPAAMAAPTPVSALVHSSTLVTAGVFLLIRFSNLCTSLPLFSQVLLLSSTMTMVMAGLSAFGECDLKKIIALSTLSQLSVMMFSISLNAPSLAFFHLLTHALFKALLFICAGMFIHLHSHNQDLRLTGALSTQLPFTTVSFSIANLALCGTPFLAGFYSKDAIIEMSMNSNMNMMMFLIMLMATGLTTAYSIRLYMFTMTTSSLSQPLHHISDNDSNISWPTLNLTFGAITSGAAMNWSFTPLMVEPFIPFYMKQITLMLIFTGFIIAWKLNTSMNSTQLPLLPPFFMKMNEFSYNMWNMTPLSTQFLMKMMPFPHKLMKNMDHGWLEIWSAQGLKMLLTSSSTAIQPLQASSLNHFIHMSLIIMIPMIMVC